MSHVTVAVGAVASAVGVVASVIAKIDPAVTVAGFALVTAFGAYASPWVLARQTTQAKVAAQTADWGRQDALAAQTKADAAALLKVATEAAAASAKNAVEQKSRDDDIHRLVNANYTAALESDLQGRLDTRTTLLEMAEMRVTAGQKPSAATTARLAVIDGQIAERQKVLVERARQQAIIDAKASEPVAASAPGQVVSLPPGETVVVETEHAP